MALPIAYNIRNLMVRKTTTILTALGISLTAAILVADLALVNGLRATFQKSGNPLQLLILRNGSNSELVSAVTPEIFEAVKPYPGIARGFGGEALVSPEIVTVINLPSVDGPKGMNVTIRGIASVGMEMRNLHLLQGRWFQPGLREVTVGASIAKRYPGAQLGKFLHFGRGDWKVVGIFDGDGTSSDSEIWGDLNQISSDYNRQDAYSSILVRAVNAQAMSLLLHSLENDRRLNVAVEPEREYYEKLTNAGAPLQVLGFLVAGIMAVGGSFAAMNTMYAMVAKRAREIGTLRVLGFSKPSILCSFLLEALLLAALGGLLGCLLPLPLNMVTTGVGSFTTFSEIAFRFRVTPSVMWPGFLVALLVGALGGLLPARLAAKKEILVALREG